MWSGVCQKVAECALSALDPDNPDLQPSLKGIRSVYIYWKWEEALEQQRHERRHTD